MATMSVNYTRRANPEFVKENVEIIQYSNGSFIACRTCGGPVLTQSEFADVVGVRLNQLQSFLHRRPIREDVAAKIRTAVHAVRKAE